MSRGLACVLFLSVVSALALIACEKKVVKETPAEAPYAKPSLEFRGIAFADQSFSGMKVEFKFELQSTDARPARVGGCDYKLELEDLEAVQGPANKAGDELAGQGKLEVEATAGIPWPQGVEAVQAFLERKRIPYKFFLKCKVEAGGKAFEVENTDAGSVPLPKLPKIDVLQANAERFGRGEEAKINFELGMVNENSFDLPVDKIVYRVFLEEKLVTEGDMVVAETVSPQNEVSYDVATPVFSVISDKEVMQMLKKPAISYRLEGTVQMGQFTLPLDATGTISFPQR